MIIRNYSACFIFFFSIYKKPSSLVLKNKFLIGGLILYCDSTGAVLLRSGDPGAGGGGKLR